MDQRKDHALAGILSFIIPGAGQMYCGAVGEGIMLLIFTAVGYAFFIFPGLIIHISTIIHAVNKAKAINAHINKIQKEKWDAEEIKRNLEIERQKKVAEEQLRQEKESASRKIIEDQIQPCAQVQVSPAEVKIITADEFAATIEKLYGLYIKSIFSVHEYSDRKKKEIDKLRMTTLVEDEITFLDKLLPLMEKKILMEGDMQLIKEIMFNKVTTVQ